LAREIGPGYWSIHKSALGARFPDWLEEREEFGGEIRI